MSCASGINSYSIDPVREVMFNEGEVIPFERLECTPDPVAPGKKVCPVVGIFVEDFRTVLDRLEACEGRQ